MVDSANRGPKRFPHPNRFDIARDPTPSRRIWPRHPYLSGRSAGTSGGELSRFESFEYTGDESWQPREGLIAHGPSSLSIRFTVKQTEPALDAIEECAFPPEHVGGSTPLSWNGRFSEIPAALVVRMRPRPV
jgi:hypothetical protein